MQEEDEEEEEEEEEEVAEEEHPVRLRAPEEEGPQPQAVLPLPGRQPPEVQVVR